MNKRQWFAVILVGSLFVSPALTVGLLMAAFAAFSLLIILAALAGIFGGE